MDLLTRPDLDYESQKTVHERRAADGHLALVNAKTVGEKFKGYVGGSTAASRDAHDKHKTYKKTHSVQHLLKR